MGIAHFDEARTADWALGHLTSRWTFLGEAAGTGIAHVFRGGEDGLRFLAYGTRDPGDITYYPRSDKIAFRGLNVIGRIERLDYWDGED